MPSCRAEGWFDLHWPLSALRTDLKRCCVPIKCTEIEMNRDVKKEGKSLGRDNNYTYFGSNSNL